jgi:hypothetical protein
MLRNLRNTTGCDVMRVNPTNPFSFVVNLQHDTHRLFVTFAKKLL